MAAPRTPRRRRLPIALSDAEWARIEAAAAAVHPGLPASAWARETMLRAADAILDPPTDPEIKAELVRAVEAADPTPPPPSAHPPLAD
jgi:hypothetical protein